MPVRYVCQFSCGASSAVAARLTVAEYGDSNLVEVVNALVAEEHPDNRRFLADCESWIGRPIHVVQDVAHGASARALFRRRRYLKGRSGAPCSKTLKRNVLDAWQARTRVDGVRDVVVLGYDADEQERLDLWIDANPDRDVIAPLITAGLRKPDILALVQRAGIELPMMYRLGYHNANCIGCVKGGAGYWNKIRRDFPEAFEEMAAIEESIGPGARLLRHRGGPLKGKRFYLRELPPDAGNYPQEPAIECGAACEYVERSEGWDDLQA